MDINKLRLRPLHPRDAASLIRRTVVDLGEFTMDFIDQCAEDGLNIKRDPRNIPCDCEFCQFLKDFTKEHGAIALNLPIVMMLPDVLALFSVCATTGQIGLIQDILIQLYRDTTTSLNIAVQRAVKKCCDMHPDILKDIPHNKPRLAYSKSNKRKDTD